MPWTSCCGIATNGERALMNCYLDSSVVLRILFDEPHPLQEWKKIHHAFSSRLLRIECFRTIDRLRTQGRLSSEETAEISESLRKFLERIGVLPVTSRILERVEQPFLTPLGTLDAIHLATSLLWQETRGGDFSFATHDEALSLAARAHGFKVIGV